MANSHYVHPNTDNSDQVRRRAHSVEQAMYALDLSRTKLYEELNSGRLRSFQVGARRLISETAIDDYILDREAETAQERAV